MIITSKQLLNISLGEHWRKVVKNIVRTKRSEPGLYLLAILEPTPTKSHQHDILSMNNARTTLDVLMWTFGKPTRLQPYTMNYR